MLLKNQATLWSCERSTKRHTAYSYASHIRARGVPPTRGGSVRPGGHGAWVSQARRAGGNAQLGERPDRVSSGMGAANGQAGSLPWASSGAGSEAPKSGPGVGQFTDVAPGMATHSLFIPSHIYRAASTTFPGAWVQSRHPVRPFGVLRLSTGQTVTPHPHLLSPVLQVVNRAVSTFLIKQAGLKRTEAQTGAVTLIQRFGSAANLKPFGANCIQLSGWR